MEAEIGVTYVTAGDGRWGAGGVVHQRRDAADLQQKLEKARKQIHPWNLQKEYNPADNLVLTQWNGFGL